MKDYIHNLNNDGWASETILYKLMRTHFIKELINTKVEILEDNTEEIEELDRNLKFDELTTPYGKNEDMMWTEIIKQHNKINEIIRYIKRKEKE